MGIGLGAQFGFAQTQVLQTRFDHAINRYKWQADFKGQWGIPKGQFRLQNTFNSEAFVLGQNTLIWRDENLTFWRLNRALSPKWAGLLRGKTAIFSQNKVFSQEILGGFSYEPHPSWRVEPALGFAWDRRTGASTLGNPLRLDRGWAAGFLAQYQPNLSEGSRLTLNGSGDFQQLTPRQHYLTGLKGQFERKMNGVEIQTQLRAATLRRETYQMATFLNPQPDQTGEVLEAILSDTLETALRFQAPLYKSLRWLGMASFSANDRKFRTTDAPEAALFFDTDLKRRKLNGEIGVEAQRKAFNARFTARWGVETEQRSLKNGASLAPSQAAIKGDLLRKTDFDRSSFSLNGGVQSPLGPHFQIQVSGAANILRHNTPETNPDDRDEVFHNGDIRLIWLVHEHLQAAFQVLGTFYHTVYLKAERSAENNKQRSLRWRPSVRWQPVENTSFTFSPEVRATYTVEDFELAGRRKNDQSARELGYDAAFEHRSADARQFNAMFSYSDLRLGRLLWDRFAEIPFDTVQTVAAWARYRVGTTWQVELGLRLFHRADYDRSTTLRYDKVDADGKVVLDAAGKPLRESITRAGREKIRQFGPTVVLAYPFLDGSSVQVEGWLQFQNIRQVLYATNLPNAALEAAQKGSTRLIPNLKLEVTWRF